MKSRNVLVFIVFSKSRHAGTLLENKRLYAAPVPPARAGAFRAPVFSASDGEI